MTKNSLSEVSFGTATIQRMRRVALDANMLRTLGLAEGDSLEVVLLVDSSEILLRKSAPRSIKTVLGEDKEQ